METKAASVCVAAAAVAAGFYIYFGPTNPERKRNKRGLCAGMHNLGNTCFMNSVFQGLASLASFASWLESYSWNCGDDKNVKLGQVMGELMKELNTEWYEEDAALTATPIIQALRHHGWVIEPDQQDAHEFFQVLFSSLDDEIGELPAVLDLRSVSSFEVPKEKDSTDGSAAHRNRIPLVKHCSRRRSPFRGLLASQLVCKTCATKCPVKFDGCDSLSLSLPSVKQINLTLEDLLRQFVCSETVDFVKCKGCSRGASDDKSQDTKSTFIKRLTLGKVPQCLCIHVQRTYWHSDGIPYKNDAQVKFSEYLNLVPFMYMPAAQSPRKLRLDFPYSGASTPEGCRTPTNDLKADLSSLMTSSVLSSFSFSRQNSETRTRTVYRLTAVTTHLGDVSDGHYVTYRRFESPDSSKPGVWLYTSDDFVDTIKLEEVLGCNPYMLYYERCPAGFDFEPMVESIVEESLKNIVL